MKTFVLAATAALLLLASGAAAQSLPCAAVANCASCVGDTPECASCNPDFTLVSQQARDAACLAMLSLPHPSDYSLPPATPVHRCPGSLPPTSLRSASTTTIA